MWPPGQTFSGSSEFSNAKKFAPFVASNWDTASFEELLALFGAAESELEGKNFSSTKRKGEQLKC